MLAAIPDEDIPDPNSTRLETSGSLRRLRSPAPPASYFAWNPGNGWCSSSARSPVVGDDVGAEILESSPTNFRQILSRARRDLYGFLQQQCGLVNEESPCRCAKKTRGSIDQGFVSPDRPQLVTGRLVQLQSVVSSDRYHEIQDLERRYAQIYRDSRLLTPADHAAQLRDLLRQSGLQRSRGLGE